MKTGKRILATFLVVLMLVTSVPVYGFGASFTQLKAQAIEENMIDIKLGEKFNISYGWYEAAKKFAFTPTSSGVYSISVIDAEQFGGEYTCIRIYDENLNRLSSKEGSFNFSFTYQFEKDVKYYLEFQGEDRLQANAIVNLETSESGDEGVESEIAIGDKVDVSYDYESRPKRLRFIPDISGIYTISVDTSWYYDITIYDEDNNRVADSDCKNLTYHLEKDKTYFFVCQGEDSLSANALLNFEEEHNNTRVVNGIVPTDCQHEGRTDGIYCEDCDNTIYGGFSYYAPHSDNDGDFKCDICGEITSVVHTFDDVQSMEFSQAYDLFAGVDTTNYDVLDALVAHISFKDGDSFDYYFGFGYHYNEANSLYETYQNLREYLEEDGIDVLIQSGNLSQPGKLNVIVGVSNPSEKWKKVELKNTSLSLNIVENPVESIEIEIGSELVRRNLDNFIYDYDKNDYRDVTIHYTDGKTEKKSILYYTYSFSVDEYGDYEIHHIDEAIPNENLYSENKHQEIKCGSERIDEDTYISGQKNTIYVTYLGKTVYYEVTVVDNPTFVKENVQKEFVIDEGKTATFTFTPETNGVFGMYNIYDADILCKDKDGNVIFSQEYYGYETYDEGWPLKAGEVYTFELRNTNDYRRYFNVEVYKNTNFCPHIDVTEVSETAPVDCATAGFSAGKYCNDCEKWLEGHEIITIPHTDEDYNNICDACGLPISDIVVGEKTSVALEYDGEDWYYKYIKFVPVTTAKYRFSVYSEDVSRRILDSDKNNITFKSGYYYDGEDSETSYADAFLTKGNTYYLYLGSEWNCSVNVMLSILCDHSNSFTNEEKQPTDCSEIGYTAGIYCNDCEKWIDGHKTIVIPHTDENADNVCDICGGSMCDIMPGGGKVDVSYDYESQPKKLRFIPIVSGLYTISVDTSWYYNIIIYDEDNKRIADSDCKSLTYHLEKDKTYFFVCQGEDDGLRANAELSLVEEHSTTTAPAKEATCAESGYTEGIYCKECKKWVYGHKSVVVPHTDANSDEICDVCGNSLSDIKPGETKTIEIISNEITYLKYIPTASGRYTFTSHSSDDTYGYLFDENKEEIARNDDYDDANFKVTSALEAGKTYYWGARYYNMSRSGSFDVELICDEIFCEHKNTENIPAREMTCTEDGITAGVYCNDCEKWIRGHEIIKAHHTDENADRICDVCGNEAVDYRGFCNDEQTASYKLYSTGELEISGTGVVNAVWGFDFNLVKKITVEEGITELGFDAFHYFENVSEVSLPSTLEVIGGYAFALCGSLKSIELPENLKIMGEDAFAACGLESVEIPEGIEIVDYWVFSDCSNLKTVKLPSTLKTIGTGAFIGCERLEDITIPDGVETIGDYAFKECTKLTSITIPEGITYISENMFYGCRKLSEITIPNSVTSIGGSAFEDCNSLTSITIPNSVTSIEYGAFYGCSSLTSITIPDSVTSIDSYAFKECTKLTSITIPNSVTSIEYEAFYGCSSLTSITIPDSVTSIGSYAFAYCTSLENVTISDNVTSVDYDAFYRTPFLNNAEVLYVGKLLLKVSTSFSGEFIVKDGTEIICNCAFIGCDGLTEISIPNGVKSIGWSAFEGCRSLNKISLPDTVEKIGNHAFENTAYFNNDANWDGNVLYLGKAVISSKEADIDSLIIKDGTEIIADFAFGSLDAFPKFSSFSKVNIPDSVKVIGSGAFYFCNNLKQVSIPNSVTAIGGAAFGNCTSLTEITIPESITSISDSMFEYCESLENITIPNSVKSIEDEAFSHCSSLISIIIPGSVTNIGEEAFYRCENLTNISIPESVSKIGKSAFGWCDQFKNITILNPDCEICPGDYEGDWYATIPSYVTIHGYANSTAQKYAEKYNIEFVAIGEDVHEHSYTSSVTTPATCKNEGVMTYTCECGESYTETIAKLPHTESSWITDKNSDCINGGTKHTECAVCGEIIKTEEISATGHTYVETVTVPTCTDQGYTTHTCSVCGSSYSDTIVPAFGHTGGTTNCKDKAVCTRCGESYGEVNANNHKSIVEDAAVGATCTTTGLTSGSHCEACGVVITAQTSTDMVAHTESEWITDKNSDCVNGGTKHTECTVCGEVIKTEEISATGHTYVETVTAPTCTAQGYTTHTCSVCGSSYSDTIVPALGHTGGTANCTDKAVCTRCNTAYGEVDTNNHKNIVEDAAVEATCTATGLTAGSHCETCGVVITAQTSTDMVAHTESGWITDKNSDCVNGGTKHTECTVCGEVIKTEEISATGHTYVETVTAPTCTAQGYTTHTCSVCGSSYSDTMVSAFGHTGGTANCTDKAVCTRCGESYGEVDANNHKSIVEDAAVEATCTATGLTAGSHCLACGVTIKAQETVATLDHTSDNGTVTKKATCSATGIKTYKCTVCGEVIKTTTIKKTAHNSVAIPAVEATCTKTGLTEGTKCSVCGEILTVQETVAKKAHTYKNVVTKATLSANGKVIPTCSVCKATKSATTVYYPKTFKLSATSYNYDGKAKKPTVTVTDSNGKAVAASNYTVAYKNNTNIGTATVTVTFKGNYSGTKKLTFKIVPGQVKNLKQAAVTATTFKLTWDKVSGAKYYKIEWSADGKKWTADSTVSTNSAIIKSYKAGTKYQFRVTALDSTKKIAGKASAVLKTQTLCVAPTIKLSSTKSKTVTVSWSKVAGATGYVVWYSKDNKNWTKKTTTATSYSIKNLTGGKKLYVKVQATNAYKLNGSLCSAKSVTVKK